jgi:hypothetical protein
MKNRMEVRGLDVLGEGKNENGKKKKKKTLQCYPHGSKARAGAVHQRVNWMRKHIVVGTARRTRVAPSAEIEQHGGLVHKSGHRNQDVTSNLGRRAAATWEFRGNEKNPIV